MFPTEFEEGLCCPSCGNPSLHHYRVDVFERNEDSPGLHVMVLSRVRGDGDNLARESVGVDADLSANPSARRNGVSVRFWCEGCDVRSTLHIAQHKGTTHLDVLADGEGSELSPHGIAPGALRPAGSP